MNMRTCNHPNCETLLGPRNKSGVCLKHYRKTKKCKKCGGVCSKTATYCIKCGFMARSFKATHHVVCQFGDCDLITGSIYNLCVNHFRSYWKCEVPGCTRMLKYSNKWQVCTEHHDITRKLIAAGIKPAVREPLPLLKKRLNSRIRGARKQRADVIKVGKKMVDR